MKTKNNFKSVLLLLACSGSLCAQLQGSFNSCDPNPYAWYIGGNSLAPLAPPPHVAPPPMDLGTCSQDPLILKSNNIQMMFITPAGYIGVNNSLPNAALDIKSPTSGQQSNFKIYADLNGNVESSTSIRLNYASGKEILFNEGTAGSNTTRMAIRHGGQVNIGNVLMTSSPYLNTALLSVNGQAIAKEVVVTQQFWSDFVFDKNYKLMPLSDVESYYKENHHLPAIPTTKEIVMNGNELGKTDALLLQKIEELTLYVVEQQKEIEELKKEVRKN